MSEVTQPLDYPVAAPEGIDPVIYRAQIIQTMAATYKRNLPSLADDEAMEAAIATWKTDWDDHPALRNVEAGIEAVEQDLQYWGDDG